MSKSTYPTLNIKSVSQLHQVLGLPKPKHPLITLIHFEEFTKKEVEERTRLISDLYQITLKKECPCKLQYGQTSFDFDEGVMSFFSPNQILWLEKGNFVPQEGWVFAIHPDFFRTYPLGQKIKSYGFFDYAVNEALILSEEEQKSIENIVKQLGKEIDLSIDRFSQDVIIAIVDLLLTYSNRYYTRQFIMRKPKNDELLNKVEELLSEHFHNLSPEKGLPSAAYLASKLNLSPKYLSDCLKQLTGQTTQQIIHEKLIEQAKEILAISRLSVSEIAYSLGFEYPQSFSKLFKSKTNQSPLEFRQSFN